MLKAYLITATLIDTYRDSEVGCLEKLVVSTDVDVVRDAFIGVKEAFRQQITEHFDEDIYIDEISDGTFSLDGFDTILDTLFTHDDADLTELFQLTAYPIKQSHNLQLQINAIPIRVFIPSDMTGFIDAVATPHYTAVCLLKTENPDDGFVYIKSRQDYTGGAFWN